MFLRYKRLRRWQQITEAVVLASLSQVDQIVSDIASTHQDAVIFPTPRFQGCVREEESRKGDSGLTGPAHKFSHYLCTMLAQDINADHLC